MKIEFDIKDDLWDGLMITCKAPEINVVGYGPCIELACKSLVEQIRSHRLIWDTLKTPEDKEIAQKLHDNGFRDKAK
jgi:hypothetical protein